MGWKNFRKQTWAHLGAMAGDAALVKGITEACNGDLKVKRKIGWGKRNHEKKEKKKDWKKKRS